MFWININAEIENTLTCLEYWNMSQEKTTPCKVPDKPWEVVGTDVFMIHNKKLLSTVDYYSKFLVIKKDGEPVC